MSKPAGPAGFTIRLASADDVPLVARHRCEMFKAMGQLSDQDYPLLLEASDAYLREALPSGEYVGWLVSPAGPNETVVAGGGVQLRRMMPRPSHRGGLLKAGPQALIVNVWTVPQWRHRGLAEFVVATGIEWCREQGVASVVLHASEMGRSLYERMGFVPSTEMYFPL